MADRELEQKPLEMRLIRRMFAYTRPYARTRNLLLALVVLRAIQLPTIGWAIAAVISGPIANGDEAGTLSGILALLALVLVTEVTFMYRMRLALSLGESVVFELRRQLYEQIHRMPMSFFHRLPLGRLISRMTSDVDVVRTGIQDVVFVSTVQLGSMLIAAALMLYYDWLLFMLVMALVPVLWLLIRHFRDKMRQAYRDVQETYSRVTSRLAETVNGMRVIQGFVRQHHNHQSFLRLIDEHSENNLRAARYSSVFVPLLEVNGQLFLAVLLVVGGYQALSGSVGLPALIQFLFLSHLFFGPIPVLGGQYNQALTAMAGAERVFALLDETPDWEESEAATPIGEVNGRVEFVGVGFEYRPGVPVLTDVSFSVRAGQTVALVGETGGGKSTVARLLSKLYLPTSGSIRIDGQDIRAVQGASLHRQLGSVPQDNYLFAGSVFENLRFAKPEATRQDALSIARRLDIEDVLENLPQGLETEVGEKGGNLSLGERQLVCFARAMLADPKILILDEATSSVDALTEARLERALAKLLQGRTSFIVAHRLSTIRRADLILVVSQGRIVEQGNEKTLLAAGGAYAALYRETLSRLPTALGSE